VFDVFTGEPGQPLFRPRIATGPRRARLSLGLVYERGRDRAGHQCAVGRVRAWVGGFGLHRVRHVTFRFDGRRVRRDRRRPFTAIVRRRHKAPRAGLHRVVARVALAGGGTRRLTRRVRTCRR
jgi:hypothetical protein